MEKTIASKKAQFPIWSFIIVVIIGLIGLVLIINFYLSATERAAGSLTDIQETTEISCDERCVIKGYGSGSCKTLCGSNEIDVGLADCQAGQKCCCIR
jgi:hypothetical protein